MTEGESDLLALLSVDPTLMAAAMPGTGCPADRLVKDLIGVDAVILVFDGDHAGHKATIEKAKALVAAGVACHDLAAPDGLDLADCLVALPPEQRAGWLRERLYDARPVELPVETREDQHTQRAMKDLGELLR